MIKLISPKYLGTRTSEGVKQRVIELLYSWTRQMPQVGGVALSLNLTDAVSLLAELLYSWTRQMPQVGGVVLPLDLTDAAGRWSCSALGFDRCHMWVDCPWI